MAYRSTYTRLVDDVQFSDCSKTARASSAIQTVESRHVFGIWCQVGTLLDLAVGGGGAPLPQTLDF